MSSNITIEVLNAAQLRHYRPELIGLLQDAVDGGASVGFIAPLDQPTADNFWSRIESESEQGSRIVLAAVVDNHIVGSAQLALAGQANGGHRAEVQKMLVHRQYRRQGIAKRLLEALDQAALQAGRHLLVLDTERNSAGEALYERYGYIQVGIIPDYALDSSGQHLIDTVVFYRRLS